MYYQIETGEFVLDPVFQTADSSYSTVDDEIRLLITNKKNLKKELEYYFGPKTTARFDKKVGAFNQYIVEIKDVIRKYVGEIYAYHYDLELYQIHAVYSLEVSSTEISNKRNRSKFLADWVLEGANPTQFFRLLNANFSIEEITEHTRLIRPKVVNVAKINVTDASK